MLALKPINYRGGDIRFAIPSSWIEEYEPDGGGVFYEKDGNSTLRLNILTMDCMKDLADDEAVNAVSRNAANRQVRKLPNGKAVARYLLKEVEEGVEIEIHFWELACPLPPRHMRLAVFSYTVLSTESKNVAIINELELLDRSILAAEFAKTLGVTPSKPWWRFW